MRVMAVIYTSNPMYPLSFGCQSELRETSTTQQADNSTAWVTIESSFGTAMVYGCSDWIDSVGNLFNPACKPVLCNLQQRRLKSGGYPVIALRGIHMQTM